MKKKKRPGHCFVGHDYSEEKCRDVECRFKELCRKLRKRGKYFEVL